MGGADDDDPSNGNGGARDTGNRALDEGNRLFLRHRFAEAVRCYDRVLAEEDPEHLGALNNKGYALSKLKDFEGALRCYDAALAAHPDDPSIVTNMISSLRKVGRLEEGLSACDRILGARRGGRHDGGASGTGNNNIVLYHKERILFAMGRYDESVLCCDEILRDYPANLDLLFDRSCGLAMGSRFGEAVETLEAAVEAAATSAMVATDRSATAVAALRAKIARSKHLECLRQNPRFQRLVAADRHSQ